MEFILSRVLVISLAALALFFIPDAQAQEAKKVGTNKIDISITPRFQYVRIEKCRAVLVLG